MSSKTQHVYFICDKRRRYVKMGVSNNPWARLYDLQAGSPLDLKIEMVFDFGTDRTQAMFYEDCLHQHFAEYWRQREWFDYGSRIKDFIARWKKGERVSIPEPPHTAKQAIGQYGACLSKFDYMALLRAEASQ